MAVTSIIVYILTDSCELLVGIFLHNVLNFGNFSQILGGAALHLSGANHRSDWSVGQRANHESDCFITQGCLG